MAKVLIPLAKGFEELEAVTIIDMLRRAKCEVIVASLEKELEVHSQGGIKIIADKNLEKIDSNLLDAIVLPGGLEGTYNLADSKILLEMANVLNEKGKVIAAICAAPFALFKMEILKDQNFTCYPGMQKQIQNPNYKEDNVVRDGNIITSRGPATALDFALFLVEVLVSKEKAQEVKKGILKF